MRMFIVIVLLVGGCAHGVRCDDHLIQINQSDSRTSSDSSGSAK